MRSMLGDWAIRSIDRARIVESLLRYHFGWNFAGTDVTAARAEVNEAVETWLHLGLCALPGPNGEQLFDPAEVLNFMISAGVRGDDGFWELHYVATLRGHFLAQQGMVPDSLQAPDIAALAPRRFALSLQREYRVPEMAAGSRLRLRLPVPIEDHATRNLEFECRVPPGATAKLQAARLDVSLAAGPAGPVTIGIDARFEALVDQGSYGSLDDRERDIYTRPHEMMICVDERTADIASTLVAGIPGDWPRVLAIFDYVIANFQVGAVPYHALDPELPTDWSFRTGIVDCHVAAALFCAMCRSLGIPARLANGYCLFPLDMSYHYWAEVWIEERGWVGFDSIVWHLSHGGRDPAWRGLLAGVLDFRIKTQVFPDIYTGPSSVRLPHAWHLLTFRREHAYEMSFVDANTGATVYTDSLSLK